jgi:hypothetical protein
MDIILIYLAVAVVLFVAAYVAKRRFGLLGLALAAGYLLSDIWGDEISLLATGLGFGSGAVTSAVVTSVMVILPPAVLMFHGYIYKNVIARSVGAALFAVLALAFLVEPLGRVFVPSGQAGREVYDWIANNNLQLIAIGMTAAIIDVFMTKPVQLKNGRRR